MDIVNLPCAPLKTASLPSHSGGFERDFLALIPQLRAFSRAICRRRALAEDMTQEALTKAWRARDRFEPGSNLKAWLFRILRNEFYSHLRRSRREASWDTQAGDTIAAPSGQQEWTMELADMHRAFARLPEVQRQALVLVGAGGLTYEEAAEICTVASGTMKSRLSRGRATLKKLLEGDKALPSHAPFSTGNAMDDILAQLSAMKAMNTKRTPTHA